MSMSKLSQLSPGSWTVLPGTRSESDVEGPRIVNEDFRWTPPTELQRWLPPVPICVDFRCFSSGPRLRRFRPLKPYGEYLGLAATVGVAIEQLSGKRSTAQIHELARAQLLFQQSSRPNERLIRTFHEEKDLTLSREAASSLLAFADPSGQQRGSESSIIRRFLSSLPEDGRRRARELGADAPLTFVEALGYGIDGLAEAYAVENKGTVSRARSLSALRLALFDLGRCTEPLTVTVRTKVRDRFAQALRNHLDDPAAAFNNWFFENFDGIVKQISTGRSNGGPISRDIVQQALLELTFESWSTVGKLASECTALVQRAIVPRLCPHDAKVFTASYGKSPLFGPIPLMMLADHIQTLKPSFTAVLEAPASREAWIRLLRAMEIYGAIVSARRHSELQWKRKKPTRTLYGGNEVDVSASMPLDRVCQSEQRKFLLDAIPVKLTCRCGRRKNWEVRESEESSRNGVTEIRVKCTACGKEQLTSLDVGEIQRRWNS